MASIFRLLYFLYSGGKALNKKEKIDENPIPSGMQVEFICPRCGNHLAWALPETQINCPRCGCWVTNKNRRKPEQDLMLPLNDDQLTLF